jgi:hypothetical protein
MHDCAKQTNVSKPKLPTAAATPAATASAALPAAAAKP